MPMIAKIFRNGASQAVRLPKEFRFNTDEVCIKRIGSAVLLYPKETAWELMESTLGQADDDFLPHRQQPAATEARQPLE